MARPVEFEKEDVLNNAMEQFWREGYEASSVQKLLDVTGINRGTLYNSFGDKDTFFKACLDHYNQLVARDLDASLNNSELAPWEAVERYFDLSLLSITNKRRSLGCLIVNSFCSSINYDKDMQKLLRSSYNTIRKAFVKRMKEADKAGKIRKGLSPEAAAEMLMTTLSGLRVSSREGRPAKQMGEMVSLTLSSLQK